MAITRDAFVTELDNILRERYPDMTSKGRCAIIDEVVQKEESVGSIRLWDYGEVFRLEHLGYMLDNLSRERPEAFEPAPTVEQAFAAKVAALQEEFGDDKSHPFHPDKPSVRRDLIRQIERMDGDARADFVKGLKIPAPSSVEPDSEKRAPESEPTFSGPGDPRFRAWVARTYGTPEHQQLARKNAEIYRALTATNPQRGLDKRTLAVAETQVKTRELSPAELREQARAQQRLARAAR